MTRSSSPSQLQHAEVDLAVVGELLVDLVGDEEQVVLLGEGADGLQLLLGIDGAGGVVRRAEEDGARARGQLLFELGDVGEVEAVLGLGGHRHDLQAALRGVAAVVGVEGLGDDDLVAGVGDGVEGEGDGLAAAGGDDDILDLQLDLEIVEVVDHGDLQGLEAVGGAVGEDLLLVIVDLLVKDLGGVDVGLADVQVVDGRAALLGRDGQGGQLADRGFLDVLGAQGDFHGSS